MNPSPLDLECAMSATVDVQLRCAFRDFSVCTSTDAESQSECGFAPILRPKNVPEYCTKGTLVTVDTFRENCCSQTRCMT